MREIETCYSSNNCDDIFSPTPPHPLWWWEIVPEERDRHVAHVIVATIATIFSQNSHPTPQKVKEVEVKVTYCVFFGAEVGVRCKSRSSHSNWVRRFHSRCIKGHWDLSEGSLGDQKSRWNWGDYGGTSFWENKSQVPYVLIKIIGSYSAKKK